MITRISLLILFLLAAVPLWSQNDTTAAGALAVTTGDDSRMQVPPPVSAESYPTVTGSEARSNYLRTGLTVTSTYSDNVLGGISPRPVSDESYSVWPYIAFDETTSRLHSTLTFDPGFTFYQRTNNRNEADENAGVDVSYRLSPHVTLSAVDSFRKSSNLLNQPNGFGNSVSGSGQASPVNVIAPVADQLSNTGTAQLTYQFGPSAMVGVSGVFTNLHYSNPAQVPGLFDSGSRGGSAFYAHRISRRHYIGATYEYQMLLAYPTGFRARTQADSLMFFYTIYLKPNVSLSFLGGPQYSDTEESIAPSLRRWSPSAGASLAWQERQTSLAISYWHSIAAGGGLTGAVHQDACMAFLRRQLTRTLMGGVQGSYSNNKLLDSAFSARFNTFSHGGHLISGAASLQQQLGAHFALSLDYSRIHQTYSNIAAISGAPDTNRGSVSISYQFARPMGR
jgi:hypothetical protein